MQLCLCGSHAIRHVGEPSRHLALLAGAWFLLANTERNSIVLKMPQTQYSRLRRLLYTLCTVQPYDCSARIGQREGGESACSTACHSLRTKNQGQSQGEGKRRKHRGGVAR